MAFLANLFGYLLNFIYNLVNNYGVAILIFSVIVRIVLLPISIKQQRTMKKTAKIQEKTKQLQFKYKNNPEQLTKETMALYKEEKMSPFSGCLSGIIQIVLLLAVFYLVQSPLTYMKKVDPDLINQYKQEITQQNTGNNNRNAYPEIQIIRENGSEDDRVYLNMNFLGLDLSLVPISNLSDVKVYIIPVLYVISSVISIKLSNKYTRQDNKIKEEINSLKENKRELENEKKNINIINIDEIINNFIGEEKIKEENEFIINKNNIDKDNEVIDTKLEYTQEELDLKNTYLNTINKIKNYSKKIPCFENWMQMYNLNKYIN